MVNLMLNLSSKVGERMKKIIFFLIIFFICLNVKALPLPVDVTADSAVLVNMDEDQVVYSKNPDKEQILASLTKIMTAYTAIQHIDNLYEKITITQKDLYGLEGFTLAGLEEGDKVSYLDLLYAMMLPSGADASQALANHIAGNNENFVKLMNEEAYKLGMYNSHFKDSYGGADENVSTARELAICLREVLINPKFYKVFTAPRYTLSSGLQVFNYTAPTAAFYGFDTSIIKGSKSGYTPEAGLLLASTAVINDVNYVLVVCKSELNDNLTSHVLDSYRVYNYVSDHHYEVHNLLPKGTELKKIKVEDNNDYIAVTDKDITYFLSDEDYAKVKYEYHIVDEISKNNKKGDNLGYVDILIDDEVISSYGVYLTKDPNVEDIFETKKDSKAIIVFLIFLAVFVVGLLFINIFSSKKK